MENTTTRISDLPDPNSQQMQQQYMNQSQSTKLTEMFPIRTQ